MIAPINYKLSTFTTEKNLLGIFLGALLVRDTKVGGTHYLLVTNNFFIGQMKEGGRTRNMSQAKNFQYFFGRNFFLPVPQLPHILC